MQKRLKGHSAFTLTEVIVSAVVFALAMAGVFSVINYLTRQQQVQANSVEEVQATLWGQQVIEELRSCVNNAGGMTAFTCLRPGTGYTRTSGGYTARYNIIDDGMGGRRIEMDVTW